METLYEAIQTTPIIDHHAHNLLTPAGIGAHELLSITSEAQGPALKNAKSTLAHIRAVKQLAGFLGCEPNWEDVQKEIGEKRKEPDDAWARECFGGIETVLIDDGLNPRDVLPYIWHNRLTRSRCKRIVRIERVAEIVIERHLESLSQSRGEWNDSDGHFVEIVKAQFIAAIEESISLPDVAGFKSVICYRGGLVIPNVELGGRHDEDLLREVMDDEVGGQPYRLEHAKLNPYFVHLTAQLLRNHDSHKPFQFHTGLGDNDINLGLSNPSHLQTFIKAYPTVNIVLLHASYPFMAEAGYLSSVYKNVYMDIGEVFPFLSQDGQERVIREALELCPSEKLTWSTDGHWFPETYLLATIQVREGMGKVLSEYVGRGSLSLAEAIKTTQDIFFNTSNRLYELNFPLTPIENAPLYKQLAGPAQSLSQESTDIRPKVSWASNLALLQRFLEAAPSVRFLRLQWLDYTSTLRVRVLPIARALEMLKQKKLTEITKAVLGLLQQDQLCEGFTATGIYNLYPCFQGLRLANRPGHATVQCEFQDISGDEVAIDPRTILRRQVEKAAKHGLTFLTGFEIEVVFMKRTGLEGYIPVNRSGHAWSTARALKPDGIMELLETIVEQLELTGIEIQQFHSESAPGQYEFVLGPLPPLEAVDTLIAARETISSAAANAGLHATLFPKTFPQAGGTGAHTHISVEPADGWESFYAGLLKHLRGIAAFTYPSYASYERVVDGAWAGGRWIAWGTQNRETPLRRIEGSHFEIKCIDGLANPYLALAALLGAGIQGVLDKEALTMKECLRDPAQLSNEERAEYGISEHFPKTITGALYCLQRDNGLEAILGKEVVETYLMVKREEIAVLERMEEEGRRRFLIEWY